MLLAAIGEVESSSLRGRSLDARHDVVPPVRGPALSGGSFAAIHDTDGGRFDGDPVWDRAVGPMQFIPGTWRLWGADANGDGVADPQNVEDATLAAARYLCAGGRDLTRPDDLRAAVRSYNHSDRYVRTVLGLVEAVTSGEQAGP
ncbi:lytic transglycosylase domain-containing protein [Terrabacter sp. MAHUQ-38]|nr:lytic transglycosylase domain-containing protein [Terrabacter sp. MAHUQ-38]